MSEVPIPISTPVNNQGSTWGLEHNQNILCPNCQAPDANVDGHWVCLKCPDNVTTPNNKPVLSFLSNKTFVISYAVFTCMLLLVIANFSINPFNLKRSSLQVTVSNIPFKDLSIPTISEINTVIPQKITSNIAKLTVVIPASSNVNISDSSSGKHIVVSISQQYLWAYIGSTEEYSSPVITGANALGEGTPVGTWKIYGKASNVYLRGPTWDDFVQYWMPFYGPYGLHDASWRDPSQFGITSYPEDGSHGCVELPTATAAWLYGWALVGTSVTIEN